MPDIGVPELLIVAVIVLLLFGPAKAADLGGALGKSIREFRKASSEDIDAHAQLTPTASAPAGGIGANADAAAESRPASPTPKFCTNCGTQATGAERFCTNCGAQRS
jgi:sec-independent protein translocase protein TatA